MPDTSTISRADVSNHEKLFGQMAAVDRDEVFVGKLPTAEESVHKELIIHSLEVQSWGILRIKSSPYR